jgi:subtilase family serine protease
VCQLLALIKPRFTGISDVQKLLASTPRRGARDLLSQYMKGLLKPAGRIAPARFLGHAVSWRRLETTTLGIAAMLLLAPCGAFALSDATLALSPTVAKSTLLSAMDPAQEIIIQFTLPLSDRQGAEDLAKHVSTPKDALYHHYITAQEFAARFGANAADYATVRAWAVANGLSIVHEATARTSLTLRGTVAQVQRLFKTQLNYFKTPAGDQFYSASVAPTIPSELVSKIQALVGLTGGVQKAALYKIGKTLGEAPETSGVRTDTAGGTGPGGSYGASDLRQAYQIPTFGGASGQTVAVFEDSSIFASDYNKYLSQNKLPKIKLTQIPVDQPDVGAPNGDQVEAVLDVDMIAAINPDVKLIQVYVAPATDTIAQFSTDLIDVCDAVGQAFSATGAPQTLSVSYGLDELQIVNGGGDINAEASALVELADVGVTVLASAGDQGAYGRTGTESFPATLNVGDPGSQIWVTSVGGTSLFTGPQHQYGGETVWNDLGLGDGATGGGVSAGWELPPFDFYQAQELVTFNGGSGSFRNVPDVAAVGDPLTGVGIYVKAAPFNGWVQIGGTSVSAPIWAGYVSILNAAAQSLQIGNVGFFNPALYFSATDFFSENYFIPAALGLWYPVLDGTNGSFNLYGTSGFEAGQYYNNCTGLGSLFGPYAYQYLTSLEPDSSLNPTNLAAKPAKTSAKITWTPVTGATGYVVYLDVVIPENGPPPTEFGLTGSAQTTITNKSTITLKGLTATGWYAVFVAAVNNSGEVGQADIVFQTK